MDSTAVRAVINRFLKRYPDTQYTFLIASDQKYRTISIDAVEHKTEFRAAGEILEEIK